VTEQVENAADFAGVPDALARLWTPHRMVYLGGEGKPSSDSSAECPFCQVPALSDEQGLIVHRGELAYVVLNLYPYASGHLLVCPYRHEAAYAGASTAEVAEIAALTQRAIRTLTAVSSPDGFNLGINQGHFGGAGIAAHLHQHVVPRWAGDANFMPIIAGTRSLPMLLGATRERLAQAWVS
jgi:ATP adenylyltransferase